MTTYETHHLRRGRATCGITLWAHASNDWSDITCGACKLEQDAAGRVEYTVPADVLARDAALAAGDRRARAIAAVAEVQEQAEREVEAWSAIAADAASLAARLAALPLPGLDAGAGQGGASEPAETLSTGRASFEARLKQYTPFAERIKAYRLEHRAGLLEGKRAVIDADHEEALFWNEFDRQAKRPAEWVGYLGKPLTF